MKFPKRGREGVRTAGPTVTDIHILAIFFALPQLKMEGENFLRPEEGLALAPAVAC